MSDPREIQLRVTDRIGRGFGAQPGAVETPALREADGVVFEAVRWSGHVWKVKVSNPGHKPRFFDIEVRERGHATDS